MSTKPLKVMIDGKEWSVYGIMQVVKKSRRCVRHRLQAIEAEGLPISKVFDNDFWKRRTFNRDIRRFDTPWGKLTYAELAQKFDLTKSQVQGRLKRIREEGLPMECLIDEEYWEKRKGGRHGGRPPKRKVRVTVRRPMVTNREIENLAEKMLNKIPGPSDVERRMEQRGWL